MEMKKIMVKRTGGKKSRIKKTKTNPKHFGETWKGRDKTKLKKTTVTTTTTKKRKRILNYKTKQDRKSETLDVSSCKDKMKTKTELSPKCQTSSDLVRSTTKMVRFRN